MSVRDLGQKAVEGIREFFTPNAASRSPRDQKVSEVSTPHLKAASNSITNTTSYTQKLTLTAPSIRLLIKSVANAILTKLQIQPKMAKIAHTVPNGVASKADIQKQTFLKSFGDTVIQPLGITKNPNIALKSTMTHLEQAKEAGILDQKLYSAITSNLDRSLKDNVRTEISLDDNAPPEKTIHDLLLEIPTTSKTLRKELEVFAHKEKCIAKFTSALEKHSQLSPEQAREIIRKTFEDFPKPVLVTLHNVTAMLEPSNPKNPDVIIEGKYIASGAASKVHKGFSLRDNKEVVLKTSDNAAEEINANEKIHHLKKANNGQKVDGIADELTLTHVQTPDGSKTVATGTLYDNDASKDILADMQADCSQELEQLMNEKSTLGSVDSTKIDAFITKYESLLSPEEIASVRTELT
ncbi:MAG: hypothetical protein LLF94_05275 [Chlamydiales bacterium]|nr:hypothetical protein [Chlamydiales bacterium]